jgi:hypothetical protein
MYAHRLHRHGVQLDLFQPRPTRPAWRTLPAEVKQRVQRLLVRLLQEHREAEHAANAEREVSDE